MLDYEIELGAITERWDAKTDTPFGVSVDVHVRSLEDAVGEPRGAAFTVRFDVEDGVARFDAVEAEHEADDLALAAIAAATERLQDLSDDYEVVDPIETVQTSDYEVLD